MVRGTLRRASFRSNPNHRRTLGNTEKYKERKGPPWSCLHGTAFGSVPLAYTERCVLSGSGSSIRDGDPRGAWSQNSALPFGTRLNWSCSLNLFPSLEGGVLIHRRVVRGLDETGCESLGTELRNQ